MQVPHTEDGRAQVGYRTTYQELSAFEVTGVTQIVVSGGELYGEVRSDGRWEWLKRIAGEDKTIYGVASFDKECSEGRYRYTLGVKAPAGPLRDAWPDSDLFSIHVRPSGWVVFALEDFAAQYGVLWRDDPYALVRKLGWEFNSAVGLHIDAFGPCYESDHGGMEFMMPVRKSA